MNDVDAILISVGTILKGILSFVGVFGLGVVLFSFFLFLAFSMANITTWVQILLMQYYYDFMIFLSKDKHNIHELFIKRAGIDKNKILVIQSGIYTLAIMLGLYILYDLGIITQLIEGATK